MPLRGGGELEVERRHRAVGLEEQVVGPPVAVAHRGRLRGEIVEQTRHGVSPPGTDLLDGVGDRELLSELLPPLGEHRREHRLVDRIAEADGHSPVRQLTGLAPPGGMPGGQPVDSLLGVGDLHPLHLVHHPERAEVFHHEDELARLGIDRGVMARRHPHGRSRRELVEEGGLTEVHAQDGGGEHRLLGQTRKLHHHGLRAALPREANAVERAHHTDAGADLLDVDVPPPPGRWPRPARLA